MEENILNVVEFMDAIGVNSKTPLNSSSLDKVTSPTEIENGRYGLRVMCLENSPDYGTIS